MSFYPSLADSASSSYAQQEHRPENTAPAPPAPASKPQRPPPPRIASSNASMQSGMPGEGEPPLSVLPLQHQQVRWFYSKPGCYWQPFCGCDSLVLEEAHRKLLSEVAIGLKEACPAVSVCGDMYEVELSVTNSTMTPIYWTVPKPWPVMRATWFEVSGEKWYPVKEEEAYVLEAAHVQKDWREKARRDHELQQWAMSGPTSSSSSASSSSSTSSSSSQQQAVILHRQEMNGYDALWLSHKNIYKLKKDLKNKILREVGGKIGRGQLVGANRLMRGYREPASKEDKPPPIGHIVFAIHGIGQNMDSSDVVQSVSGLRETCSQVAQKYFAGSWREKRVEFIPIEWRTCLALDSGTLTSITPHGVKALRGLVNNSVIDVLYYMSSVFGPEVLEGFRWQLHKQYDEFMHRHPHYLANGGTVSLFGHSLGSVMCYDLMYNTCQAQGMMQATNEPAPSAPPPPPPTSAPVSGESQVDCPSPFSSHEERFAELQQLRLRVAAIEAELGAASNNKILHFKVDHFFAVGSPLGLFIMMREQARHLTKEQRAASSFIPSCICSRIYNIHHPSDPVAYRLEPLINSLYSSIRPVKVDSASSKPTKSAREMAEGPVSEVKVQGQGSGWWSSFVSSSVGRAIASVATTAVESTKTSSSDKLANDDSQVSPEDRLKERLDFMLKEGIVENSYLNSITAHTCYWTSQDVAMFLLLQLYSYQRSRI